MESYSFNLNYLLSNSGYVGNIKDVGRIYQQTYMDTYTKVVFCKLYDRKNTLVSVDLLNDKIMKDLGAFMVIRKLFLMSDKFYFLILKYTS